MDVVAVELSDLRLVLERIERYRAHTLTDSEENLLAMQGEMVQTANKVFRQLNDADLKFGSIEDENGVSVELSNSNFSQFLICPKREVRQAAFEKYYEQFRARKHIVGHFSGQHSRRRLLRMCAEVPVELGGGIVSGQCTFVCR